MVKVGGALSHVPGALADVARALPALARPEPVLVVPGGGPFADQVRRSQQELDFSEEAAHWMAILGMDQYALLLSERMPFARLLDGVEAARDLTRGEVGILAPYRWMRAADPLPHTWDATSDSIAVVVATALGASRLLVVKAASGRPEQLADACFFRVCPPTLDVRFVTTPGLLALAGLAAPPAPAAPRAAR